MMDRGNGTILFRNVVLLDGSMERARAADISVEGGRIASVAEAGDSYGRQQWGILHNGRKPDAATPRE